MSRLSRVSSAFALTLLLVLPATASAERGTEPLGTASRVKMVDGNRFRPATLTVSRGTRVRWVNRDNVGHTTTGDSWDSGRVAPGDAFSKRFRRAGTFDYRCTIHVGMTGTIVVT